MHLSRRRFIEGSAALAAAVAARATPVLARPRKSAITTLFEDDFQRRDRSGWGGHWFNQRYGRRWEVNSKRGLFRLPATENRLVYKPNPVLVLDHDVADVDVRVTISLSNETGRGGLAARAVGYADLYTAYLAPDGVLRVSRFGHQKERRLAKAKFRYRANRRYRIRMQVRGAGAVRIRAKVWPAGTPEPLGWMIETVDTAPDAITTRGAFGLVFQPPTDRRSCSFRIVDFIARSNDKPSTTSPALAFSMAGPPAGSRARVVAKAAVPADISFEVAADPTFTRDVQVLGPRRTNRAGTARGSIDLSGFGPSSLVYWRAVAQRRRTRVVGPTATFRSAPTPGLPVRFAFGSCTKWQPSPKRSFDHARLKVADFYLHQGDFGYVPSRVVDHAPDTYQDHWSRMMMDPSFSAMTREMPVSLMRDDADYGRDLADSDSLRRFTIHAHDQLNANPARYFQTRYGDVAVFSIDCRRFSTGKRVPAEVRSKLGADQKEWLKRSMRAAADEQVGLLVVSSPQAFGSDANVESWRGGYSFEWSEMVDFFQSLETPVLIVSGDAHGHRLHEYPQKNLKPDIPRIVEIVSSGTEQTKFFDHIDPQFLLKKAKGSGFGLVEVGAEQDAGGQRTRSLTLTAVRTSDGSPFWTANYLIVRGVGILPIVG